MQHSTQNHGEHRPRRSAKARREQKLRSDTRMICRLLSGCQSLSSHRGSALSQVGHSLYDILQSQSHVRQNKSRSSMPICRHFLRSSCSYGDSCRFAHPDTSRPAYDPTGAYSTYYDYDHDDYTQRREYPHADQHGHTHFGTSGYSHEYADTSMRYGYSEFDLQRDELLEQQSNEWYAQHVSPEPEILEPEIVEPEHIETEAIETVCTPETAKLEPEILEPEHIEPEHIETVCTPEPARLEPEVLESEHIETEAIETETLAPETLEPETLHQVGSQTASHVTTTSIGPTSFLGGPAVACDQTDHNVDPKGIPVDPADSHDPIAIASDPSSTIDDQQFKEQMFTGFMRSVRRHEVARVVGHGSFADVPPVTKRLRLKQAWTPQSTDHIARDLRALQSFSSDKSHRLTGKSSSESWKPAQLPGSASSDPKTDLSIDQLKSAAELLMQNRNAADVTIKQLRLDLEAHFGLDSDELYHRTEHIKSIAIELVTQKQAVMKRPAKAQ